MSLASYDETVSGYADHLRRGGTTSWSAWLARPDHPAATMTRPLPDAVHLELVRRLNEAADVPAVGLADRVLATASPGRGLIDVPLPWPAGGRGYGSPATDPARLPEDELIRLAVGVLVHLLPGLPAARASEPAPGWPMPWRRRFLLHGAPGTVAAVRHGLLRQGLVESDWRTTHVVIARPVEVMMAEHWATSARDGGILKWSTLWRRGVAADRLPAPIDIARIAQRLEGRGRPPVHVVVARDAQQAAETSARLLRARTFVVAGTGDLGQTDLLRRANRLTALTAGPDRVRDLAARLAVVLEGATPPGSPKAPSVPRTALGWAREQADRTAHDVAGAGYAVHGDPGDLAPAEQPHPGTVDRGRTLELAVLACLRTWRLQGGTP
jgi:hypothetical protein